MELIAIWDLLVTGILRGGNYILIAMGLSLVFGVMNTPNFAHGEFYMIGAYIAYFTSTFLTQNPIVCILMAAVGGFICGAVMEVTTFQPLRKRSVDTEAWVMNSFMVTAGVAVIIQNLVQAFIGVNYKGIDYYVEGTVTWISSIGISADRIFSFVLAMVFVTAFWLYLTKTKSGNSIRAVAENELGAMLIGINIRRVHTLAFALSGMLAAVAGAALISINPAYPMMGLGPLYKSWFVVILVGMGNVGATVAGGFIVGILEACSSYFFGPGWEDIVSLTVISTILIVKPSGLFGKGVKGIWEY